MICALIMLAGCFIGCANTAEPAETTEPAKTEISGGSEETSANANLDDNGFLKDDLPEGLNFNETVSILYWSDCERAEFDITEYEADTDIVKDAIYRRNLTAQARLGVTFEWTGTPGNTNKRKDFVNFVNNCYSGGTYYDIIAAYSRTAGMLLTEGFIQDFNTIEDSYINTSQPWWPKSMLETCSIKDSLFYVSGDISTNILHFMYAVYYNMDMLENLHLDDPVQFVDNNTWTIDKLIEMSKGLYSDLDQDGTKSVDDQYGFVSEDYHLDAFYTGSGLRLLVPDEDSYLKISDDFFGQKTTDLVDKLGQWFKAGDTAVQSNNWKPFRYREPFDNGNCLFRLDRVYAADYEFNNGSLRNADFEYGILPVPLYDENQEDYITVVGNPYTLWCIMQNAKNPSMSTAVIECLASEGYRKTSPALFESNMKYRYTPDNAGKGDGARMFDIIRATIAFDQGRTFGDITNLMSEMPSNAAADSISWSSVQAKYKTSLKRSIADLNKALGQVID